MNENKKKIYIKLVYRKSIIENVNNFLEHNRKCVVEGDS